MSTLILIMVLNAATAGLVLLPNDGPTPAPVEWSEMGETNMDRNDW